MARAIIWVVVRSVVVLVALGSSGVTRAEAEQWGSPPQPDPALEASDADRGREVIASENALEVPHVDPGTSAAVEKEYETANDRFQRFDDGEANRKRDGE